MRQQRIGVLMGGNSSEREISLKTGRAVYEALAQRGHDGVPLELDEPIDTVRAIADAELDVAFIALHGRYG
jgi:D-alanine-D-alanine ligase